MEMVRLAVAWLHVLFCLPFYIVGGVVGLAANATVAGFRNLPRDLVNWTDEESQP